MRTRLAWRGATQSWVEACRGSRSSARIEPSILRRAASRTTGTASAIAPLEPRSDVSPGVPISLVGSEGFILKFAIVLPVARYLSAHCAPTAYGLVTRAGPESTQQPEKAGVLPVPASQLAGRCCAGTVIFIGHHAQYRDHPPSAISPLP